MKLGMARLRCHVSILSQLGTIECQRGSAIFIFTPFTPDLLIGVLSVERPYSNVRHAPNSHIFKYNFVANKTDNRCDAVA